MNSFFILHWWKDYIARDARNITFTSQIVEFGHFRVILEVEICLSLVFTFFVDLRFLEYESKMSIMDKCE